MQMKLSNNTHYILNGSYVYDYYFTISKPKITF